MASPMPILLPRRHNTRQWLPTSSWVTQSLKCLMMWWIPQRRNPDPIFQSVPAQPSQCIAPATALCCRYCSMPRGVQVSPHRILRERGQEWMHPLSNKQERVKIQTESECSMRWKKSTCLQGTGGVWCPQPGRGQGCEHLGLRSSWSNLTRQHLLQEIPLQQIQWKKQHGKALLKRSQVGPRTSTSQPLPEARITHTAGLCEQSSPFSHCGAVPALHIWCSLPRPRPDRVDSTSCPAC